MTIRVIQTSINNGDMGAISSQMPQNAPFDCLNSEGLQR